MKRDVVDRRQFNLDKKRTIAAKAFKLIKNNETIFLDISTTNIELAKLLATSNMRVVVVSNPCHKSIHYRNRYRGNNVPDSKRIYGSCNDRSDQTV